MTMSFKIAREDLQNDQISPEKEKTGDGQVRPTSPRDITRTREIWKGLRVGILEACILTSPETKRRGTGSDKISKTAGSLQGNDKVWVFSRSSG